MNPIIKTYVRGPSLKLTTIVFAIFLTCKLTGYINWPWWLVISPLLVAPATVVAMLIASLGCFGIAYLISHYRNQR